MSHRGYNVGRAHQPRRHTAGAESRSFSAEGGNRQSSPESAVGPSNERSPSEFCPPNALISASFSQALLPGDRTGSLFEEGEASCLQEAGPHTNSQVWLLVMPCLSTARCHVTGLLEDVSRDMQQRMSQLKCCSQPTYQIQIIFRGHYWTYCVYLLRHKQGNSKSL